jgi:estrone sulfotransferase
MVQALRSLQAKLAYRLRWVRRHGARRRALNLLRPDDVVIVAFPRSGTNWTSFLVANALADRDGEPPKLIDLRRLVPELNGMYFDGKSWDGRDQRGFRKQPGVRFFRCHAPYDPGFPKVVYIVRDPRDVLVSYFHLQRLTGRDRGASIEEIVTASDHWPCSWDAHVRGWALGDHDNVLVVSYEELHEDAASVLQRILGFADVERPRAAIEAAVRAASFEQMRRHEETTGVPLKDKRMDKEERMIRRGRLGSWRDELDDETVRAIESAYGETMMALGYVASASPRSPELAAP